MNDTIGVDISKDSLDAFWLSKRKHKQFADTKTGLRALTGWIREAEVPSVVFEATGIYHRLPETSLAEHDFSFARVECKTRSNIGPQKRLHIAVVAE